MSHNNNEVLRCPFNNSHAISKMRFQRHLVKCEKNYPPDYKVICPYDATHRIDKDKIVEHINTCPVRKVLEGSYLQFPSEDAATSTESDSVSESDCKDHWNSDVEDVVTKSLRNSYRYSEPMNQVNESDTDDLESQVSAVGIGRGTMRSNYTQYFDTESDAEPMVSSMAVGRGRMIANTSTYQHRFGSRGRKF